jgi:hypothetical protein
MSDVGCQMSDIGYRMGYIRSLLGPQVRLAPLVRRDLAKRKPGTSIKSGNTDISTTLCLLNDLYCKPTSHS